MKVKAKPKPRRCYVCHRPAPVGLTMHMACRRVTEQIKEAHADEQRPEYTNEHEAAVREQRLMKRCHAQ